MHWFGKVWSVALLALAAQTSSAAPLEPGDLVVYDENSGVFPGAFYKIEVNSGRLSFLQDRMNYLCLEV